MKRSKFVNKEFDNGWVCTGCNLAANYAHGTKHNRYWYAFERKLASGGAQWIRVEATDATKIYKGELAVEAIYTARVNGTAKHRHGHSINHIKQN